MIGNYLPPTYPTPLTKKQVMHLNHPHPLPQIPAKLHNTTSLEFIQMLTSVIIQQINNQSTQIPVANTTMVTTPVAPQNNISWDPDPKQKELTPLSTPKKEKPKEKAKP
jgi:hypothetical protein